ncbi:hypothetical protein MBH78_20170 [Oceanimonas sp. NS1]|nr:hypothetical protein [Oceanimonas sp. NS1]
MLASLVLIPLGVVTGVFGLDVFDMSKRSLDIYTQADGRFDIYAHGLRMWLEKPWTGYGYGSFESAFTAPTPCGGSRPRCPAAVHGNGPPP